MRVAGKSVVVIGGTSGIGAATVRLLVAEGAEVLFAGRRPSAGERLAAELGDRAWFRRADVNHEPQVEALFAEALERFGDVDGAVNCAGESLAGKSIAETDVAQLGRLVADLATGAAATTKHAARAMSPRERGTIVHVTSVAADAGGWSGYAYSAGKAAVAQIVRSAAVELGEAGIRVNAVSPGPIMTGIFAKAAGVPADQADEMTMPEADFVKLVARWQSTPRAGRPDDVAGAILWLLSDASEFVNGACVPVDGGISAGRPASAGLPARAAIAAGFGSRTKG